ncbi:Macrolide export ATP-binding/permease protein MacB [compost metagenome]
MIPYAASLALRGLKRHWPFTALITVSIAIGISTSSTMLTVMGALAVDPLPSHSGSLYHVQMDPRPEHVVRPGTKLLPTVTLHDAQELMLASSTKSTFTAGGWLPARSAQTANPLRMLPVRGFTHSAPSMFGMTFLSGGPWSADEDSSAARVAIITQSLANELFPGTSALGATLELATKDFIVVGVISNWDPKPRFYDLDTGAFKSSERIFIPIESWLALPQDYGNGRMRCWNDANNDVTSPQCAWLHFWISLASKDEVRAFQLLADQYASDQISNGRTTRSQADIVSLINWLDRNDVIPPGVRIQMWLSFGILLVSLVNANGLLLAKFMSRSSEFGIRRALGATRAAIFAQCIWESAALGALGGIMGAPLAALGIFLVRRLPVDYANQLSISWPLLIISLALAIISSIAAGALPAWRVSRVSPQLQIKTL